MKIFKSIFLLALAVSAMTIIGCDEDDPDPSLVNFDQTSYNITTDDLSPFEVTLTIDPAAREASEIVIAFSGGTPGTEFTTTPAASADRVTVPVAEGDSRVSFIFTPDAAGIGFDDVNVEMSLSSVGAGLNTGIFTEATVSITNLQDTGTDIPYTETFDSCEPGLDLPGGFEAIVAEQNSKGSAGWRCVTFAGVGAAASNPFTDCGDNESDPSEVWLVSPRLNLTEATAPTLSFDAALVFGPFEDPDWDVVISIDYNGGNFEDATWTRLEDAYDQLSNIPRGNETNPITQDLSEYTGSVATIGILHIMPGTGCDNSGAFRVQNFSVRE